MRALVVDDSRPIRGIIAKIMRSLDFETTEVCNGREAIESLERDQAYDVVTVNWEMPVMDGLEFVDAVRRDQRFRSLPLLMISSESDQQRVATAMRHGVDQYIVKPCTLNSIAKKLLAMGLPVTHSDQLRPGPSKSSIATPNQEKTQGDRAFASSRGKRNRSAPSRSTSIRVLVVDDSAVVRRVLQSTLDSCDGISVVGSARDGIEGLEKIRELKPDAVLLDVDMPRMDGLETLRKLRSEKLSPPVLMFSSRTERGAKTATDALLLGAKDFVFKPGGANMTDLRAGQQAVIEQIVPRLQWLTRNRNDTASSQGAAAAVPPPISDAQLGTAIGSPNTGPIELVAIAASTGGPAALAQIMVDPSFRSQVNVPVVIAQHMPALFTAHLAARLKHDAGLDVAEATDGEYLHPGMLRIAPGGRHTAVAMKGRRLITVIHDQPPVNSCRPSADVLFQSAAECLGNRVLAVVLTGMGHDGREGAREIKRLGGRVLAQDEATSVVWGMPASVARAGLADELVPLADVGSRIAASLRCNRA